MQPFCGIPLHLSVATLLSRTIVGVVVVVAVRAVVVLIVVVAVVADGYHRPVC